MLSNALIGQLAAELHQAEKARVQVEQLGCDIDDFLCGLALGFLPLVAAEFVQWSVFRIAAAVAADQIKVGHRHIQFRFIGIFHYQEFSELGFDLE